MYVVALCMLGTKADFRWCCEPERQSGPDIATRPKLLPSICSASTRSRLFSFPMSSPVMRFVEETLMETVVQCCAGLDVHKKTVVACVRRLESNGKIRKSVRSFGTMTRELLALSDWMADEGVTHVAMESTGVFWKPVYHLLEDRFEVLLVNAQHIKQVPGRKTDTKDCEWIAQLLQHGLLRGSFVPPRPLRELRDLTRHRAKLTDQQTAVVNRIHKVLEDANIKLASVASDIMGASGLDMLSAIVEGETDPTKLADLARRRLRGKIPALRLALEGKVTEHHRFLLKLHLDELSSLKAFIEQLNQRIEELTVPFAEEIERLTQIPGIQRTTAENVLAEIGPDMSQFPTSGHLASWTGICPGNHESAGKRKSGKTTKGNRWLRRALTQAAWAAQATKGTYLKAQYRRLVSRRGKKRAIIAVAHTILEAIHHMLIQKVPYHDLGSDYFERLDPERLTRYLVKRLERLGHTVVLTPTDKVA